jgi:restriction system protein
MKNLPKFHETFIPILDVLAEHKILHYDELRKKVRDKHYACLPEDLLKLQTKSGDALILNRIGWAKAYLKEGGFVEQPIRGQVRITDKGTAALKKGSLTLKDLKADRDYIACQQKKMSTSASNQDTDIESTPQDLIDAGFNEIETLVKSQLLNKLKEVDPYYFQKIILILLNKMGYGDYKETSKSSDGGIDGVINQDQLGIDKIYIQAKRYSEGKVREPDIRNFIGAMSGDTTRGVFVTTSSFDEAAIKKANAAHHKIILIDGIKLCELMYQYGIGVQIKDTYYLKSIDNDFFDGD